MGRQNPGSSLASQFFGLLWTPLAPHGLRCGASALWDGQSQIKRDETIERPHDGRDAKKPGAGGAEPQRRAQSLKDRHDILAGYGPETQTPDALHHLASVRIENHRRNAGVVRLGRSGIDSRTQVGDEGVAGLAVEAHAVHPAVGKERQRPVAQIQGVEHGAGWRLDPDVRSDEHLDMFADSNIL